MDTEDNREADSGKRWRNRGTEVETETESHKERTLRRLMCPTCVTGAMSIYQIYAMMIPNFGQTSTVEPLL